MRQDRASVPEFKIRQLELSRTRLAILLAALDGIAPSPVEPSRLKELIRQQTLIIEERRRRLEAPTA